MHTAPHTTATSTPAARGRILAYQPSGQGTVSVAGVQYPFDVASHWRSDTAPAVNTAVDVRFNGAGAVDSLCVVTAQQIAQEEMKEAAKLARAKGLQFWSQAVSMLGIPVLICIGALLGGAFFLNVLGVRLYGSSSFSFWQMLGMPIDNLEHLSRGASGSFTSSRFFFLVAIAACFAAMFVDHAKAALGKCAPLLFLLGYSGMLTMKIRESVSASSAGLQSVLGGHNVEVAERMIDEMLSQVWRSMSFGAGAYVLLAAAIALAAYGYGEYKRKSIV